MTGPEDARVKVLYRAECTRCGWKGEERRTFSDADGDRLGHLLWHILGEIKAEKEAGKP